MEELPCQTEDILLLYCSTTHGCPTDSPKGTPYFHGLLMLKNKKNMLLAIICLSDKKSELLPVTIVDVVVDTI
jgi:hypothetical protein